MFRIGEKDTHQKLQGRLYSFKRYQIFKHTFKYRAMF